MGEGPISVDVHEGPLRQVGRSFAFILVVGDHGAGSKWCQRETETFLEMYGPAALERLYFMALTQEAIRRVRAWPIWQKFPEHDAFVTPFFSPSAPDRPMPIFIANGIASTDFVKPFLQLRENLAESIEASLALQPSVSIAPAAPEPPAPAPALVGVPASATLYVESNRVERSLWQPIGRVLRERWDRLQPTGGAAPALRVRGLPLDNAQGLALLGDADGVLMLWGEKTPPVLLAQIDTVEASMPHDSEPCPGAVAHLSPPQPAADEPVPAWGWPVLRFLLTDAAALAVHPDDGAELDHFLREVMSHAAAREVSGQPPHLEI